MITASELKQVKQCLDQMNDTTERKRNSTQLSQNNGFERRLSQSYDLLNLHIKPIELTPPRAQTVYLVKDVFTTLNGSWTPTGEPYQIDMWARKAYLIHGNHSTYFAEAGSAHHLFAAVLDVNGQLKRNIPVFFGWPSGSEIQQTKESGWANFPIYSTFWPKRGETGPFYWYPEGVCAETVCGGGLPEGLHVSTFAVWQEMGTDYVTVHP